MNAPVLLDTGPLVAYLDRSDHFHDWARAHFVKIWPPQLTCEAVLTEACFLLRTAPGGSQAVLSLLSRGLVSVSFRLQEEATLIAKLLARYANVPMSLADACLVRLAERHPSSVVFTLDHDFLVYRKNGRQVIPTLLPPNR